MASFEDFMSKVPLFGAFFEPDSMDELRRQTALAQQQTAQMAQAAGQGRMQGLRQTFGMFAPYNQALSNIYGPQYQIPFDEVFGNPMGQYNQQQDLARRIAEREKGRYPKPEI
jgi:hypothetical protein